MLEHNENSGKLTVGAFHSTKNSGLSFRNFRVSNGTVFSTRPDRSRSIPTWAHFPTKNYLRKCWRSMIKVAVSNAVLSCFMCRRLTRIQNSTLPWYLWEKLTHFSYGWVCKPGKLRNDQSTIFQEIRCFCFRSRIGSNYGRSFCI